MSYPAVYRLHLHPVLTHGSYSLQNRFDAADYQVSPYTVRTEESLVAAECHISYITRDGCDITRTKRSMKYTISSGVRLQSSTHARGVLAVKQPMRWHPSLQYALTDCTALSGPSFPDIGGQRLTSRGKFKASVQGAQQWRTLQCRCPGWHCRRQSPVGPKELRSFQT
jgi:hypothetical protein